MLLLSTFYFLLLLSTFFLLPTGPLASGFFFCNRLPPTAYRPLVTGYWPLSPRAPEAPRLC